VACRIAHAIKSPKAAQQNAPDLPLKLVGPDPQVVGYQNQNHGQVVIRQTDNEVKLQPVHGLPELLALIEPGNGAIRLVGYSGGASCREMVTILITGSSFPDEEKAMMLDGMKDVRFRDGNVVNFMVQSSPDIFQKAKAVYECPEFQKTRDEFMDQFSEESKDGEEKKILETSSQGNKTSSKGNNTRQKRTVRLKFYPPSDAQSTTGSSSSSTQQRWSDLPESDDETQDSLSKLTL